MLFVGNGCSDNEYTTLRRTQMKQCKDCKWKALWWIQQWCTLMLSYKHQPLHCQNYQRKSWLWFAWWIPKVLLITLALLLGGCGTTIRYNPETGEVYYHSDTGKEFSNLSIIKQANGDVLVEVNKYKGDGIGPIVEGAVRGAIKGMKP